MGNLVAGVHDFAKSVWNPSDYVEVGQPSADSPAQLPVTHAAP